MNGRPQFLQSDSCRDVSLGVPQRCILSCTACQAPAHYSNSMYKMEMGWGHDMWQHTAEEEHFRLASGVHQLLQNSLTIIETCHLG